MKNPDTSCDFLLTSRACSGADYWIPAGGMLAISVVLPFASLFIVALLDSFALVLGQPPPMVILFAYAILILRREFLPAIDVSPDSLFVLRA